MLITLKSILTKAHRRGYAVGAFNIQNTEALRAVLDAARCTKSPVIVQTSEGAVSYAGMDALCGAVHGAMKRDKTYARVPVVLHLDHGKDPALVERAIKSGWYTSVMVDASAYPYKKNVAITRRIVRMAHRRGISVEAELGAIAGIEDFVSVAEREAHLTNPEEARRFVKETGCDALAIAVGTAHGAFKFKGEPKLEVARLRKIKAATRIPLVLHGASGVNRELIEGLQALCGTFGECAKLAETKGVPDRMMREAIRAGINKVNIDTDLRIAWMAGVRDRVAALPTELDPRKILGPARDLMQKIAERKMRLFGCAGRS